MGLRSAGEQRFCEEIQGFAGNLAESDYNLAERGKSLRFFALIKYL